jgi:small subunit ribosomal protein S4e
MHQTRQETTTRIPIKRKGTKYVARALINPNNAVPVLVAIRDMLKLARTAREVNELRKDKLIKINGRTVIDSRESIQLFSSLTVGDKSYRLSLLATNKFFFDDAKDASKRVCKIIGKRLVNGGQVQYSLHDGSSIVGKADMAVNDSVYLDNSQKMLKHVALDTGATVFITSGRYVGLTGKVTGRKDSTKVIVKIDEQEATLPASNVVAQ